MTAIAEAPQGAESATEITREAFRDGMACLAGAVNIVTTDGPGGRAGLTASAVCAVTDEPPTLLVCVNRGSSAGPAFLENEALCVNTVGPDHRETAMLFGGKTPMAERFSGADWGTGPSGAPVLAGAVVSFDCRVRERSPQGTHEVLFCEILRIQSRPGAAGLAYFGRTFHDLEG
ncbi:flavin reductase [Salipiger mucosus]|uniref:Putative flavin reductase RutF n=1 Tax=Salipiger mucosus DSM 16094 TaxID=1123237 RepID=S9RRQ6_9RHOB|nr:flavin reductase [Salipiger mucosus]EPX76619.1 putative flavin reductase RutF [Salipiger mucosus DSM 16094]